MITSPKLLIGLTLLFVLVNWICQMMDPRVEGWGLFSQVAGGEVGLFDWGFWSGIATTLFESITWNYSIFVGSMFGTFVKTIFICISLWIVLSIVFEVAKFIKGFIPFLGSG